MGEVGGKISKGKEVGGSGLQMGRSMLKRAGRRLQVWKLETDGSATDAAQRAQQLARAADAVVTQQRSGGRERRERRERRESM